MPNLAETDELFFNRTDLDRNRVQAIVDDALTGCDDGELFLEYTSDQAVETHGRRKAPRSVEHLAVRRPTGVVEGDRVPLTRIGITPADDQHL